MWYNSIMAGLLRSPLHGVLSQNFMLVRVTGRKSGKAITTPVNYVRDGPVLWVLSQPDRKWWRNLKGGAPVAVLLAGRELRGHGEPLVNAPEVTSELRRFLAKAPTYAKYLHVALDATGQPVAADCERAAQGRVMVRICLE